MELTKPSLQLRHVGSSILSIFRLHQQGKPIPPKWLDSHLQNEDIQNVHLLPSQSAIEREVEHALYDYELAKKAKNPALKKALQRSKWNALAYPNKNHMAVRARALHDHLYKKLLQRKRGIQFRITLEEFALLRPGMARIMYFHGNQALTGAPFLEGGIANHVYFQWGNLLGVAKYTAAHGERILKGNLLVYFEDMRERTLEKFMLEYQKQHGALIQTVQASPIMQLNPIKIENKIITQQQKITVPSISLKMHP